ncbi:MAG: DUF4349 domain-containing protein [Actinomycetes bacterium]
MFLLAGCSTLAGAGLPGSDGQSSTSDAPLRAGGSTVQAPPNEAAAQATEQDRLIVRTASMIVIIQDPNQGLERATQVAADAGGEVSATSIGNGNCDLRAQPGGSNPSSVPRCYPGSGVETATITLRVPVAKFDSSVTALSKIGDVAQLKSDSKDVTDAVVDVAARIKTQRESVERVRALLKQANTITEIVQIEAELTKRQAALESMLAQEENLKNSAAMSTITVAFTPDADAAIATSSSWVGDVGHAFAAAWTGLIIGLAWFSPVIFLAALIVIIIILLIRRRRVTAQPQSTDPLAAQPGADPVTGPVEPSGEPSA